jgi:hypothetical protein
MKKREHTAQLSHLKSSKPSFVVCLLSFVQQLHSWRQAFHFRFHYAHGTTGKHPSKGEKTFLFLFRCCGFGIPFVQLKVEVDDERIVRVASRGIVHSFERRHPALFFLRSVLFVRRSSETA